MYAILFRYTVAPSLARDFEGHYGREGAWARLFGTAEGFLRTELFAEPGVAGEYLTIDWWVSEEHYREFMVGRKAEYDELDRRFHGLTDAQECVGRYVLVGT